MNYREDEAWLLDRGWVPDRNAWRLMTGRRVRIYSLEEACKFQRRSDAARKCRKQPKGGTPNGR